MYKIIPGTPYSWYLCRLFYTRIKYLATFSGTKDFI